MLVPNLAQTENPNLQPESLAYGELFSFTLSSKSSSWKQEAQACMYTYKTSNSWAPYFYIVLELENIFY